MMIKGDFARLVDIFGGWRDQEKLIDTFKTQTVLLLLLARLRTVHIDPKSL